LQRFKYRALPDGRANSPATQLSDTTVPYSGQTLMEGLLTSGMSLRVFVLIENGEPFFTAGVTFGRGAPMTFYAKAYLRKHRKK